jgi:hypothetical protein
VVAGIARSTAAQWTADLLARFAEESSPHGLAVAGTDETLATGRVAVLLVTAGRDDDRTAWFGPEPAQILPTTRTPPPSWTRHDRGPLTDVAVRAALLTGAQVRVLDPDLPGAPAEGISGLCRFR